MGKACSVILFPFSLLPERGGGGGGANGLCDWTWYITVSRT